MQRPLRSSDQPRRSAPQHRPRLSVFILLSNFSAISKTRPMRTPAPLSEAWGRQRPGAARSTPGRGTTRYTRPLLPHWTKGRRQLRLVRHSLDSKTLPQSENILSTPVKPQVPP